MGTALSAIAIAAGIGAIASGTGWRGFSFACAALVATGAVLLCIFWFFGLFQ
ncbi:hypothetical protein [Paracoccus sp. (in: a-proteobacteria)]|uniref:hypothetical protein n=1 Tax=Paracoccus sp. TaxID=267 RepID=UPI0028AF1C7E|nr:hypothetical protein [Paracoccus sp. (in: a-proteobacteria)]